MSLPSEKREIRCSACTKPALVAKRLPTGWKRRNDDYFCSDCWRDRNILRAITMPIASPLSLSWDDLRAALKIMWTETTRASNHIVRQLFVDDVQRSPEMKKLPPMPESYLYPSIRRHFPALPARTVAALEKAVTAKYRAKRREIVWLSSASLPNFRYPQPFAVPNQGWSARYEDESPFVDFQVGEHKLSVRLRGGSRYRRQLSMFCAVASGQAVQGELAVYPKDKDIMVKMVAWLPRKNTEAVQSGTLRARTAADSLLVVVNEKDERIWWYHADNVPRWTAEHRKHLQRWADDSKAEQRPVPSFSERRNDASVKYHRRVNTAADEAARALVNYARRRRFARLVFDSSDRAYCPDFVWFRLTQRIQTLCDEAGIEFSEATALLNPAVADFENLPA